MICLGVDEPPRGPSEETVQFAIRTASEQR